MATHTEREKKKLEREERERESPTQRKKELRISCAQGRPDFRLKKKRLDPKYTRWALVRGLRVIPVKKGESKTKVRSEVNLLTSRNGMVPSLSFLLSCRLSPPWPSLVCAVCALYSHSFTDRAYTMTRLGVRKTHFLSRGPSVQFLLLLLLFPLLSLPYCYTGSCCCCCSVSSPPYLKELSSRRRKKEK